MAEKALSQDSFQEASDYLLHSSRALERNTYKYHFQGGESDELLTELKNFQNPDGGFGYGLEPDIRLPFSSPTVTSVAFRHLGRVNDGEVYEELAETGIRYFERTFDAEAKRWFTVPREVNDYPHAPWWHYDEGEGGTILDNHWGSPTAEIIAYLLRYDRYVESIDIEELIQKAIERLNDEREFDSEHEIYCYLRLYRELPSSLCEKIEDQISRAAQELVCRDPARWGEYVPKPLDFVRGPESPRFGIDEGLVEENLDFLVDRIEEEGVINPNWEWDQYEGEWDRARQEWTGVLTLKALVALDRFERIED